MPWEKEIFVKMLVDFLKDEENLMKEQRPGMPINIDRQSRVTFGGGRKQ